MSTAGEKRKKVLLVCPASAIEVFAESKIRVAIPLVPYISLASLAGAALADGHQVRILDLSVSRNPADELAQNLTVFRPNFVGVTFTSFLYREAKDIAAATKKNNRAVVTIAGGVHSSVLPRETLEDSEFDMAVYGEGELTLKEIINGVPREEIAGLAFKQGSKIVVNRPRALMDDLDRLPFPAWHLYDLGRYRVPRINARRNPVGAIETSRGCPFQCIFCNKSVFGSRFRVKSPPRVVDEMAAMLRAGFREIHIWEDGFATNPDHAKAVCDEIVRRGLKFPWNVYNGIRIGRLDEELFRKLKQAGCYRVSLGIESGSQEILDRVNKGITLDQVRNTVSLARSAGVETLSFFLVGLPGETEETMRRTIDFARELGCDLNKVGIATPIPGTPMFEEYERKGLIETRDWARYSFHSREGVARHENLDYKTIRKYYDLFYKELYLSPSFIWKRFRRGLKTGDIFYDLASFLKTLKYRW